MEVNVRGRHFEVPDRVAERARRKLGRLDHYLPLLRDVVAEVDVTQERTKEPERRFVVRVLVNGNGVHLRAEERAVLPETAVDLAARVLTRQARRHKQRLYRRGRTRAPKEVTAELAEPASPPESEEEEPGPLDKVARVKRFAVKPMTTEEAVEQMELLGHDFFLFHDADLGRFVLLYRRQAGDYGLIVPELS